MKTRTAFVLLVLLMFVACEHSQDPATGANISGYSESSVPVAHPAEFSYLDEETGDVTQGVIYPGMNETGASMVLGACEYSPCAFFVTDLLVQGYTFDPAGSKYVDMQITRGGASFEFDITMIVFTDELCDPEQSYAVVTLETIKGQLIRAKKEKFFTGISPWGRWINEPGSDCQQLGLDDEGTPIWSQAFDAVVRKVNIGIAAGGDADPDVDARGLTRCVYTRVPLACGAASLHCVFSSKPKLDCLAKSCSKVFWRVVADCVSEQVFD